MNYRRPAIAVFIAFVLVTGILLGFLRSGNAADGDGPGARVPLVSSKVSEIQAVAVLRPERSYAIVHRPGHIRFEPPLEDDSISQDELQAFLLRVSRLSASRSVNTKNRDEDFGFDPPTAGLTIFAAGGEKTRLHLGNKTGIGDGYYARLEESDDVFIIDRASGELFLRSPEDFREKRVFPDWEQGTWEYGIRYSDPNRDDVAVRRLSTDDFLLINPIKNTLDFESALSLLEFPLRKLKGKSRFHSDEVDPAGAGAAAEIDVRHNGEVQSFRLYERATGDALLEETETGDFFVLAYEDAQVFHLDYREMLDEKLYHVSYANIEEIVINDHRTAVDYTLSYSGVSTDRHAVLGKLLIPYEDLAKITGLIVDIPIADFDASPPSGEVVAELHILRSNGIRDHLAIYDEDEGLMAVEVNGTANFRTYSRYLDLMVTSLNSYTSN